jgi:hypothetical protein
MKHKGSSVSCLTSVPFNWWFEYLCVFKEQRFYCKFKDPRLQRKDSHMFSPTHSHIPASYLYRLFTSGKEKALMWCPAHITVGLIKVLHAASPTICSPCLLADLAGKCMLLFILTQRQWDFSHLHRNLCKYWFKRASQEANRKKSSRDANCGL